MQHLTIEQRMNCGNTNSVMYMYMSCQQHDYAIPAEYGTNTQISVLNFFT